MTGCLMIHGYTGGAAELEPLILYLQENTNWEIFVPILPGHGERLELETVHYEDWIETAEHGLQSLLSRHKTVHVIGFSMGGLIAAWLAARYKIGRLVLLAAAGKFLPIGQMAQDLLQFSVEAVNGRLSKNRYFGVLFEKIGSITWRTNMQFLKLVRIGRRSLAHVSAPVLIAQGMRDGLVPYKTVYYLDKKLIATEREIILFDKSRHFLCLGEDKDMVNKFVLDFLKRKNKPCKTSFANGE